VRLQVKGKNVEVSDSLKTYAQEKLGKLEKHLNDAARLELELAVEKNPSISENQIAEGTIWTKGPVLRARESSPDMRASIDMLVEKLERQARRYRDKRRRSSNRHTSGGPEGETIPVVPEEESPVIVKTKQFAVKPMTPGEAVLQLELIGHDFFVFQNADTAELNVVYRRRDGNYGLIEPQV
jgi:putative sigma-54 modulation protein